jgi:hypothetical protein
MGRDSIREALDARLNTYIPVEGLTTMSIAWQNVPFTPVVGEPYLDCYDLSGIPAVAGIGSTAPYRHLGTYVIRVMYPLNQGTGQASRQADAVAAHFARGTQMTADGTPVYVERVWKGPAQTTKTNIFYAVNVEYFAHEFP